MSETPSSIVALDRRLALVRLELVIEALLAASSDTASALASLWAEAAPTLTKAIWQPRIEEWISAAEHIVQTGVHGRYPEVHVTRLVRALAKIVASHEVPRLEDHPTVTRALESLVPMERELIKTTFTAAAREKQGAPWVAGLLRYGEDLDRESLLAAAHVDLTQRKSRIQALLAANGVKDCKDVLDLGHGLRLRKSRRADRKRVEDWSALDALVSFSDAEVEGLYLKYDDEAGSYLGAICAYRLGRFEACVDALGRCLAADKDVEEYWHLLAFAKRHLRDRDAFERIVFAHERDLTVMR